SVNTALTNLEGQTIIVPVWSYTGYSGSNGVYLISGFAQIQIQSFALAGQSRITATFVGMVTCGNSTPTATSTVEPINASFVVTPGTNATFVTNNGDLSLSIPSDFWPTPTGGLPEVVSLAIVPVTPTG